jgi:molybdenum cofactor biosynthesis enzyme MoaA
MYLPTYTMYTCFYAKNFELADYVCTYCQNVNLLSEHYLVSCIYRSKYVDISKFPEEYFTVDRTYSKGKSIKNY